MGRRRRRRGRGRREEEQTRCRRMMSKSLLPDPHLGQHELDEVAVDIGLLVVEHHVRGLVDVVVEVETTVYLSVEGGGVGREREREERRSDGVRLSVLSE